MTNIIDQIRQHGIATPDAIALIDGSRQLTYAELCAAIARWATVFKAKELRPADRLGIALRDKSAFVLATLAAAHAGITVVPIDFRAPLVEQARLGKCFDLAGVLCEPDMPWPDSTVPGSIVVDDGWLEQVANAEPDLAPVTDGDLPFVIKLSSGTTGLPKGAVASHHDMSIRLERNLMVFGPLHNHRYLSAMPLCFSGGFNFMLLHLLCGNTVILYPPLFDAKDYLEAVKHYEITFVFAVPTTLRWLLQLPEQSGWLMPSVKILLSSTAPLSGDEKHRISRHISPNFFQCYSTSAVGNIASLVPSDLDDYVHSVGRVNRLLSIEIVDESGVPLASGETGSLRVRGPGVCSYYFGSPDLSGQSERIEDGWCYTGDVAMLDAAGYLFIKGRADDLIIRGGMNIYPGVVEAQLMEHHAVSEVAVVGKPSIELGEQTVAFAVLCESAEAAELLAHCRNLLAPHMVPGEIIFRESLPRTVAGKVIRRALKAEFC